MDCKFCRERGKTWEGSDPKCAFKREVFNTDNWNCAAMGWLRRIAEGHPNADGKRWRWDDSSLAVLPAFTQDEEHCGYIVMTWYKDRGRVGQAYWMDDDQVPQPLTLTQATAVIEMYARDLQRAGH